jgi:hypothetical protein
VNVKKVGKLGDKGDYLAVVADNFVEDIEVRFLGPDAFLEMAPHEIVKELVDRNDNVADVIEAARCRTWTMKPTRHSWEAGATHRLLSSRVVD